MIAGLAGNDRISRRRDGDDSLNGGPGSDDMAGARATTPSPIRTTRRVTVTIDDLANDGAPGELDNVQTDIEDVYGSPGPDRLEGSAGPNTIDAGGGDDVLVGGGGEDSFYGGEGNDRIEARDGIADVIDCGPGTDTAVVDPADSQTRVRDRREPGDRRAGRCAPCGTTGSSTAATRG